MARFVPVLVPCLHTSRERSDARRPRRSPPRQHHESATADWHACRPPLCLSSLDIQLRCTPISDRIAYTTYR
eukprot:1807646-Prymnesium_polylepis.1